MGMSFSRLRRGDIFLSALALGAIIILMVNITLRHDIADVPGVYLDA